MEPVYIETDITGTAVQSGLQVKHVVALDVDVGENGTVQYKLEVVGK